MKEGPHCECLGAGCEAGVVILHVSHQGLTNGSLCCTLLFNIRITALFKSKCTLPKTRVSSE